jgi:hypothetical protein
MPNVFENTLCVTGPAEELTKFREFANPLSPNKLIPMPKEFKDIEIGFDGGQYKAWRTVEGNDVPVSEDDKKVLHRKYGACNGRDWAFKNWETTSHFWDCKVEERNDMVVYRFTTALGPPIPVIDKTAELYPNLSFLFSFNGYEIRYFGSILYAESMRILEKLINYRLDINDYDHNFNDNFYNYLHKAFPEIYIDPKYVADERGARLN